jgi:hypothetical protein
MAGMHLFSKMILFGVELIFHDAIIIVGYFILDLLKLTDKPQMQLVFVMILLPLVLNSI